MEGGAALTVLLAGLKIGGGVFWKPVRAARSHCMVIEYRSVLLSKMTSVIACALLSFLSEALSLLVFHKAARCAPIMLLAVAAFERC